MRLSTIKLAGFKSFVDPTSVHFPGKRVAIVGPNGCGKSNIIDAVRWVMGESQAKQLRGESMTDVIFNGSQARKPLAQASIELIFDNSDQTLMGEYGQYNQISVKRVVTRDGQSTYYLNGTRCRRRDVTDLFLGTGLGPRSYAIIEQGTISRIIEARPEDLRAYLEEVSGIAKYKERRKETEQRMTATKENLERITDVRQEIDKQLAHLEKQAKIAEKFKILKQEERQTKGYLQALQWQEIHQQFLKTKEHTESLQQQFENQHQCYVDTTALLFKQREGHQEQAQLLQKEQEQFYQICGQLDKQEQSLKYHKERWHQVQQDFYRTQQNLQQTETQLASDQHQFKQLEQQLHDERPEVERIQRILATTQDSLKQQEQQWQKVQTQFEQLQQEHAKRLSNAEVARTQIHHLELRLQENRQRLNQLLEQQQQFNQDENQHFIDKAKEQLQQLLEQQHQFETQRRSWQAEIQERKNQANQSRRDVQQQHLELQKIKGRLVSLESQQQNTLSGNSPKLKEWLHHNGLEKAQRLGRLLTVEPGFETIVEKFLSVWLQAIVTDKPFTSLSQLADLSQQEMVMVLANPSDGASEGIQANDECLEKSNITRKAFDERSLAVINLPTLADKVQGPQAILNYLSTVIPVQNSEEAWIIIEKLPHYYSVVTADGLWLGQGWLKTLNQGTTKGTFEREREIHLLEQQTTEKQELLKQLEQEQQQCEERIKQEEEAFEEQAKQAAELQQKIAEARAKVNIAESELQRLQKQKTQLLQDITSLQQKLVIEEQEIDHQRGLWQTQLQQLEQDESLRSNLQQQRNELAAQVQQSRQHTQELQQKYHHIALALQNREQEFKHLSQQITRAQQQKENSTKRLMQLQQNLTEFAQPEVELTTSIATLKEQKVTLEIKLAEQKTQVAELEQQLKILTEQQTQLEKEGEQLRQQLEQGKLALQSLEIRQKTVAEQIQESEFELPNLLTALQPDWTLEQLENQVANLKSRIERLGAINLAAIDEYQDVSQRKLYLDQQVNDLEGALATLTEAIRKIDRETRERFKETYDQVNHYFTELFPSIFGGGEAKLELVGDDLLETGVQVMARPPGKRNSTIHLLSGGEKALTALALVFSLFKLNPAPFCLLDEVDAPLDDANIGRFCNLVKKMSENVQFIFISHNKLAIEMAEQLVGVTMREPGVSRLVAVDLHEAMAMAAET